MKKSELYNDFVTLKNAASDEKNFQTICDNMLAKYKPSEGAPGRASTVKFDLLQKVIDNTDATGLSFSKLSLLVAATYTTKHSKKDPINPAFISKWVEKGKITMPVSPVKRVKAVTTEVIETTPSGNAV